MGLNTAAAAMVFCTLLCIFGLISFNIDGDVRSFFYILAGGIGLVVIAAWAL